jgi:hypothetical protein
MYSTRWWRQRTDQGRRWGLRASIHKEKKNMAREDFVTTTDEEETMAHDEHDSTDTPVDGVGYERFEQYLTRHQEWFPNPTQMILVVDPAFVPGEVLSALLAADDDGEYSAQIIDHFFEWGPMNPVLARFKIELTVGNCFARERCVICGRPARSFGLKPSWKGQPVCKVCTPAELEDLRIIGVQKAEEAADQNPGSEMAWRETLYEYADELAKGAAS